MHVLNVRNVHDACKLQQFMYQAKIDKDIVAKKHLPIYFKNIS
jgi:hypothetical protein